MELHVADILFIPLGNLKQQVRFIAKRIMI
jgi:hypothetical protein